MSTPTLELRDLRVTYTVRGIDRDVLRGVSFAIKPGESYGLVGESGCGKSTAAYASMRYLARNGQIVVARVHDEVTVKRFKRARDVIELHAENPDYPTIVVEPGEPFEIEGLAVGLIRNTMLM